MGRFIVERVTGAVLTLWIVSVVVVVMLAIAPGDPVLLMLVGGNATPAAIAHLRHQLGLDLPLYQQYGRFIAGLAHGDLGRSWQNGETVAAELARSYPLTLRLAVSALAVAAGAGMGLGVLSALRPRTRIDLFMRITVLLTVSVPVFWLALMSIMVFAVWLRWFPTSGVGGWRYLVLPACALASYSIAIIARITRASLLEEIHQDYVRTARAKGLAGRIVLFRHTLRNALIPIITVLGLQLGYLLGGAVIAETVFAYPGLGWLTLNAILSRDFPVVRGVVLVMSGAFILVNAAIDVCYAILDPRIRYA